MSSQAQCAKAIRQELKENFPETKFSVTSEGFAGGDAVNISWEDGPTTDQVEEITGKYQYGHFDGMIDMYEHSNKRDDIPQAKFVQTRRELTDGILLKTSQVLKEHYSDLKNIPAPITDEDLGNSFEAFGQYQNWAQLSWRVLSNIDLTGALGIKEDPNFTGGSLFEGFIAIKNKEVQ